MPIQGSIEVEDEVLTDEPQVPANIEKEAGLVETVLFLESEPLSVDVISRISRISSDIVEDCLEVLKEKYAADNSGIELSMITGGWILTPKRDNWEVLKEKYGNRSEGKLSRSALETLSIIAYKQPVTRAEIEHIRGVSPDNMIRMLMERQLIQEVGKKNDAPGKPVQFGTTKEFLKFFKLNSISELPRLDEKEEERFVLAR